MIKAYVNNTNEKYPTLLLDFPSTRMFLAINLAGIGIRKPASDIVCTEDEKDGVSVNLFGESDLDNRILSVLHGRTLASVNTLCETIAFMPPSARQAFEADVMENGLNDYSDLIEKLRAHRMEEVTEKFYCPLTIQLFERNEYGDIDDSEQQELSGRYAAQYEDKIKNALARYTANDDCDMAEYFDGSNGAQAKLKSIVWGVESIRGELYGVITAKLAEPLTPEEKAEVAEYVSAQSADGLGEGFEQQEIKVDDGVMYVSFWNADDDYFVKDQDEFNDYLEQRQDGGMHL